MHELVLLVHGDSFEHCASMIGGSRDVFAIVRTKPASWARCSCLVFFDRDVFECYQRGALTAPSINVSTSIL